MIQSKLNSKAYKMLKVKTTRVRKRRLSQFKSLLMLKIDQNSSQTVSNNCKLTKFLRQTQKSLILSASRTKMTKRMIQELLKKVKR
jgi:hypothetical protein